MSVQVGALCWSRRLAGFILALVQGGRCGRHLQEEDPTTSHTSEMQAAANVNTKWTTATTRTNPTQMMVEASWEQNIQRSHKKLPVSKTSQVKASKPAEQEAYNATNLAGTHKCVQSVRPMKHRRHVTTLRIESDEPVQTTRKAQTVHKLV